MSRTSKHHDQLTPFQALFPAYSQAHGKFEIKGIDPKSGKKKGLANTIHCGAPIKAWEEHLAGGPRGLGAIALLDDGVSAKWGAIDIDVNDIDHSCLEAKVNQLGPPLIICRSKSGGAHCYLFLEKPCPAKDVVDALKNWSAALGYPGVETFPKQTKRKFDPETGKPLPGNWLNLPYYGGNATERYCLHSGERLSLAEFIGIAESSRVGEDALKIVHLTGTRRSEKPASVKSREGRNGFLYSAGCRLRQRGGEEEEIRSNLLKLNEEA